MLPTPRWLMTNCQEGLFQFPTVIGGIVLAINVPGIKSGELVLDGKTLGDIYPGQHQKMG